MGNATAEIIRLNEENSRLRSTVKEFIRLACSDAVADQDWEIQITEAKQQLGLTK